MASNFCYLRSFPWIDVFYRSCATAHTVKVLLAIEILALALALALAPQVGNSGTPNPFWTPLCRSKFAPNSPFSPRIRSRSRVDPESPQRVAPKSHVARKCRSPKSRSMSFQIRMSFQIMLACLAFSPFLLLWVG